MKKKLFFDQIEKKRKKLPFRRPESNPRPKFHPAFPTPQNRKKMKKKLFFRSIQFRESNPRPNTLKRTPKWPNIGTGPFKRVYNKCLSPRPQTPSQRFDHYVLFIYGHFLTPPNWKKNEKIWPCWRLESNPGTKFHQMFPTPQNQKKWRKKIFLSTLPTPGIEPTTKHFKADGKVT